MKIITIPPNSSFIRINEQWNFDRSTLRLRSFTSRNIRSAIRSDNDSFSGEKKCSRFRNKQICATNKPSRTKQQRGNDAWNNASNEHCLQFRVWNIAFISHSRLTRALTSPFEERKRERKKKGNTRAQLSGRLTLPFLTSVPITNNRGKISGIHDTDGQPARSFHSKRLIYTDGRQGPGAE